MTITKNEHLKENIMPVNPLDIDGATLEKCIENYFISKKRITLNVLSFPLTDGLTTVLNKINVLFENLHALNNQKDFDSLLLLDVLNDDDDDQGYIYLLTKGCYFKNILNSKNNSLWNDFSYSESFSIDSGLEIIKSIYDDTILSANLPGYSEWIFCSENLKHPLIKKDL